MVSFVKIVPLHNNKYTPTPHNKHRKTDHYFNKHSKKTVEKNRKCH